MKRLTLNTEHLTELTTEELRYAVAGDTSFTGQVGCIISIRPCVTFLCTANLDCLAETA